MVFLHLIGMDIIQYMRIANTDTMSQNNKFPEKCLQTSEKEKMGKYLEARLRQCRHLSHFVVSVDILLGMEVEATPKLISSRLMTKWKQPYSRICGYVKSGVAITLARATY